MTAKPFSSRAPCARSPRPALAGVAALVLSACASATTGPLPAPRPAETAPPAVGLQPEADVPEASLEPASLPGWRDEDHAEAYAVFRATCHAARDPALAEVCRGARAMGPLDNSQSRAFFEARFRAVPYPGEGVLTAYFAPEYEARRRPDAEFSGAVRPRPADLRIVDGGRLDPSLAGRPTAAVDLDGSLVPYPDRAAIEARPDDDAIAWMRPEDLFFLQIQGSGVLTFEDGQRMKALYAANNGRPFVGIANPMRDRGLLAANLTSAEAIRAWLAEHRGPEAQAIMQLNPRYAFFSLAPDDGRQPVGAANIPLPAGRAVAVDPIHHQTGELLWIDGRAPILAGAFPMYRRLVMALDTGGAIKGPVRADLYLGQGPVAGLEAGRVRHSLRMYRLAPRAP